MINEENITNKAPHTTTVETITYPIDPNGLQRVVTKTTITSLQNSSKNEDAFSKYNDEQHKILIENNKSQEKLIIQISVLLIGSTLSFSKLLETTPLDYFTSLGMYLFIFAIICAIFSYSLAQYVCRTSIEESSAYYEDKDDKVPYPDITKYISEKTRRMLDYATAIFFCLALPITFFGISNQYKNYQTIIKETNMSSKEKNDLTKSLDPKPIPKKPETNSNNQPNNKDHKEKK